MCSASLSYTRIALVFCSFANLIQYFRSISDNSCTWVANRTTEVKLSIRLACLEQCFKEYWWELRLFSEQTELLRMKYWTESAFVCWTHNRLFTIQSGLKEPSFSESSCSFCDRYFIGLLIDRELQFRKEMRHVLDYWETTFLHFFRIGNSMS